MLPMSWHRAERPPYSLVAAGYFSAYFFSLASLIPNSRNCFGSTSLGDCSLRNTGFRHGAKTWVTLFTPRSGTIGAGMVGIFALGKTPSLPLEKGVLPKRKCLAVECEKEIMRGGKVLPMSWHHAPSQFRRAGF